MTHIHYSQITNTNLPLSILRRYVNSFNIYGNSFRSPLDEHQITLIVFWDTIFPPTNSYCFSLLFGSWYANLSRLQVTCHFVLIYFIPRARFTVNVSPPFSFKIQRVQWSFDSINIFPGIPLKWSVTLSINIFKMYFQYTFSIFRMWGSFVGAHWGNHLSTTSQNISKPV